jgi:hypothetical protein
MEEIDSCFFKDYILILKIETFISVLFITVYLIINILEKKNIYSNQTKKK